tara:strand:- start:4857 stop:5927 length:1071 start_codon:yes stop_codon:yes gene_type:complete
MNKPNFPLAKLLHNYLLSNKYELNFEKLKLQLLSNPGYPSIKAITDTLDYFSISNAAAIIPKDHLRKLPTTFIASLLDENRKYLAEIKLQKNQVNLFKDDYSRGKLSIDEFLNIWDGGVILIEKNDKKSISIFNKKGNINLFKIIIISISLLLPLLMDLSIPSLTMVLLSLIGIIACYFILREDLGLGQHLAAKVCNSNSSNTSCSEVINSKSSKLFGSISLSDAAISYFTSSALIIIFLGLDLTFFKVFVATSLPIILYSIYYQAFVIKKWCPFCLAVSGIVIIQSIILLNSTAKLNFNVTYLVKAVSILFLTYILWLQIKKLLKDKITLFQTEQDFLKFKWDNELFHWLLQKKA